jgi:hypothetical protein
MRLGTSSLAPLRNRVTELTRQIDADEALERKLQAPLEQLNRLSEQLARIRESIGQRSTGFSDRNAPIPVVHVTALEPLESTYSGPSPRRDGQ